MHAAILALTLSFGALQSSQPSQSVQSPQPAAARPDFSGEWTLDTRPVPGAKGGQGTMLGAGFVATQDAKVLTLRITANGRLFTAAYNLDGSDSKIVSPTSPGQPDEVIISHATWEGDRLVIKTITTETQGGKPYQMETRRVMWIDSRGVLLLERSGTPVDVVPMSTSAYRRVKN
jgi:hypothetical protein